MNSKKFFISLLCITTLNAREIRSPLMRDDPGYRLMPLHIDACKPWAIKGWIEPFKRKSTETFCRLNPCDPSCNIKSRCPLSTIIFGEPTFTGADAFSPASVAASKKQYNGDGTNRTLTCQPLLENSILKPCLKFVDKGVMFALQIVRRINDCWSVGVRGSVPYRNFEITHPGNCCPDESLFGGKTLENKLCKKRENVNGASVESFAYRLDVLSQLPIGCSSPQNQFPIVDYVNDLHIGDPITISNENVTDAAFLPVNARNPITVIHRADGSKPQGQFALPIAQAQTLPALPGNGQTVDDRARFVDGTSYQPLGQDTATQSELWVLPTVGINNLVPAAQVIRDNVNELLNTIGLTTEQFFRDQCCNCFSPQAKKGVGDTQTEYFARYSPIDELYLEGLFGIRFPTGRRIKDPTKVFLWPTGNNGHYEYRLGLHIGYQPSEYFMFNANSYYTWVATREEQVLASYAGATVKDIGCPQIPADINWRYYLGHFDSIFMYPCKRGIFGIDIGYEIYDKGTDNTTFRQCSAIDCLGNEAQLDPSVLEKRTHVVSHKIRTTIFYDTSIDDDNPKWSIFGGYNIVVAGTNIPKEHGPHAGIMVMY
jgi:hypothetical protein